MNELDPILALEHVSKSYAGAEGGQPIPVLEDVDLRLRVGESLAITGPSGSGKTTLLSIVGGLDRPSSGRILLKGADLSTLKDDALAQVRNRMIGFVFQGHHLLPQCSALENVLVPTLVDHHTSSERATIVARANDLLKRVGLGSRSAHRPGQLSGGERQRVAVVRALVNRPVLVLADEPTGALDRSNADELASLLAELNHEERVTMIVVTHSMDLAGHMSRRLNLIGGKLADPESPA